jgi:hypothetical protein
MEDFNLLKYMKENDISRKELRDILTLSEQEAYLYASGKRKLPIYKTEFLTNSEYILMSNDIAFFEVDPNDKLYDIVKKLYSLDNEEYKKKVKTIWKLIQNI